MDIIKRLLNFYGSLNIYYRLLPFLLLYSCICIVFAKNVPVDDEGRYLWFATNLLNGFYSPPYPDINLWNGPGYPVLLASLIYLKIPLLGLRLLNAFLLYFSLVISYKTLNLFSTNRNSFLFTSIIGLYFPIFEVLPQIMTESLTWFLISLVIFLFLKNHTHRSISWKLILLASFSIAYLAMTKVIFGYVILLMLLISVFVFVIPKFRQSVIKSTLIFLFSLFFCLPWLIYTHSLTEKFFYWTNSAGMSLYTMSSPYANELGDWFHTNELQQNSNHKVFIDSISILNSLQRDEAYTLAAINNIKEHKKKYLSNWLANVGRLLFSYPFSYEEQTINTFWTIIPNMFLIVIIVFAFAIGIKHREIFTVGWILLFLFISIYLFGCTFVSAFRRMFYVTVPFWVYFISYVYSSIVLPKIKQH